MPAAGRSFKGYCFPKCHRDCHPEHQQDAYFLLSSYFYMFGGIFNTAPYSYIHGKKITSPQCPNCTDVRAHDRIENSVKNLESLEKILRRCGKITTPHIVSEHTSFRVYTKNYSRSPRSCKKSMQFWLLLINSVSGLNI